MSKEEIIEKCETIIIGVPHSPYKSLEIPDHIEVIDIWNFLTNKN